MALNISTPFVPDQTFLIQWGNPEVEKAAVESYKNIVKERYIISKNIHTSYNEVGEMSPTERNLIINFILDDLKKQKEILDQGRLKK